MLFVWIRNIKKNVPILLTNLIHKLFSKANFLIQEFFSLLLFDVIKQVLPLTKEIYFLHKQARFKKSPICHYVDYASLFSIGLFVTPWTVAQNTALSMGILQTKILEWIPMPSSRESSQPKDWIEYRSTALLADSLLSEPPGKPMKTGVHSLSLLQGIFPT